jgi:hypothetical protein
MPDEAPFIRKVIALLTEQSWRGERYRRIAQEWIHSRRAVRYIFQGVLLRAEVDDPCIGYGNELPIGGRIISVDDSCWIELTPQQAKDVECTLKEVVGKTLTTWLRDHDLTGAHMDNTHVKLDGRSWTPGHLMTDDEFMESEARIATAAYKATRTKREVTDYPAHTEYYDGFHGFPSKCLTIPYWDGENAFVVFSHYYKYGGTSPTNMFEDLATMFRTKYFPEASPAEILWFDHWPAHNSLDGEERFHQVDLTWNNAKRLYKGPVWHHAPNLPDALREEVHRVIAAADLWTKQKGGAPQKHPNLPMSYLPFAESGRFRVDFIYSEEDISAYFQIQDNLTMTLNSYHEIVRFGEHFEAVRENYSEFNVAGYCITRSDEYVSIRSGGMRASFTVDEYRKLEQFVGEVWRREDVAKVLADLKVFYE